MTREEGKWDIINSDIQTLDYSREEIVLRDVPVYVNKAKGMELVRVQDILKAEHEAKAKQKQIEPRQVNELLLLYAPTPFSNLKGQIKGTYRFNKMIFYLEERLKDIGYGNSFVFDAIVSARAGPIPKNLRTDLEVLLEKNLVKVYGEKNGERVSEGAETIRNRNATVMKICKLTPKGEAMAEKLWFNIPEHIRAVIIELKLDLMLIEPKKLQEKVHTDYPQYKKTYTVLDVGQV